MGGFFPDGGLGGSGTGTPDNTTQERIPYKDGGSFANSPLYYDISAGKVVSDLPLEVPGGSLEIGETTTLSACSENMIITQELTGKNYYSAFSEFDSTGSRVPVYPDLGPEFVLNVQTDDTQVITTNPLTYSLVGTPTPPNKRQVTSTTFKLNGPMTNVRIKFTDNTTGIVARYIPSKAAWRAGTGLSMPAGTNVFDFISTGASSPGQYNLGVNPFWLDFGQQIDVEVRADSVDVLGDISGQPYQTAVAQDGPEVSLLTSGTGNLATVLAIGNTTGGTDISISNGDALTAAVGHTGTVVNIAGEATTSTVGVFTGNLLTTGNILDISSTSTSSDTRNLVDIASTSSLATGTTLIELTHAAANGRAINMEGGNVRQFTNTTSGVAYDMILDDANTGIGLSITGDDLTTGGLALFTSNSADTSGRNLVNIVNDNALATGATALYVQQDSTGLAIDAQGDVNISGKLTVSGLIDPTGMVLDEQASSPASPVAAKGVLWVKNNTPNELMFTDDAGTDWPVGGAAVIDTLSEVLSAGNVTGGNDILLSNNDTFTTVGSHTGTVLSVNASHTTGNILSVTAPLLTTGNICNFTSSSSDTSARQLFKAQNINPSATGTTVLYLNQASTGLAADIIGNVDIAGELGVTYTGLTGSGIDIIADSITNGSALVISSNSADTGTRNLVEIINDNTAATNVNGLYIQNDGLGSTGTAISITGGQISHIHTDAILNGYNLFANNMTSGTGLYVTASALTIGKLAQFYSDSPSTSTRNLVEIINDNTLAINTTCLNIRDDSVATGSRAIDATGNLRFTSNAAGGTAALFTHNTITTGIGVDIQADGLTTGSAFRVYSNSSDTGIRSLAKIHNDNALASNVIALDITQDSNSRGIRLTAGGITTGIGVDIQTDGLTTGKALRVYSNSSDTGIRSLVDIHNDNALASNVIALDVTQDSNSRGIRLTAGGITSGRALDVIANGLTSGVGASFTSDSANVGARNLVQVINDNTASTGTTALYVRNDSTGLALDIVGDRTRFGTAMLYTPTVVTTATYSVVSSDRVIYVDYTATGSCTITIPSAQIFVGRKLEIIDSGGNAGTNNITINTGGSETINGNANYVMSVDNEAIALNAKTTSTLYIS